MKKISTPKIAVLLNRAAKELLSPSPFSENLEELQCNFFWDHNTENMRQTRLNTHYFSLSITYQIFKKYFIYVIIVCLTQKSICIYC